MEVAAPGCSTNLVEKSKWAIQYSRKLVEMACGAGLQPGVPNRCAGNEGAVCNSSTTYTFSTPSYSISASASMVDMKSSYKTVFAPYVSSTDMSTRMWQASLSASVTIALGPTVEIQCLNPAFHPSFTDAVKRAEQSWDAFCLAAH
jgi:hypothetical protein